jgi:membrane protease subunit (stomatin/prohibitin family)
MRLAGIDLDKITPLEESLQQHRMFERNLTMIYGIETIVYAVTGNMDAANKSLKKLKGTMFPEFADDTKNLAKKAATILSKELEKGGMQVQALDYGQRKKKRRR